MHKKSKVESIQEYLERGGKIKVILPTTQKQENEIMRQNNSGPVTIMSLHEADLFYGEHKPSKKKKAKKPNSKLDLSFLPEALRAKLLAKMRDSADGEEN